MSHVSEIKIRVTDLTALAAACTELGLELALGQRKYKWYGRSVGDYPIPNGFVEEDLGKCDHAIRIPGNSRAYEIGVKQAKDGNGYVLHWDFYAGGYGLQEKVGDNAGLLLQRYGINMAESKAKAQGMLVRREAQQDGSIKLFCQPKQQTAAAFAGSGF